MTDLVTTGYWVEAPGRGALRDVVLDEPGDGDVLLRSTHGGISPGTERLVGLGLVPRSSGPDMACPGMQGSFALPVLYGYSLVGVVERGPDAGRRAFVMRPHQRRAVARRDELVWLPDDVPSARATLFPNLETAQNGVWDAAPRGGEPVLVVGAGAVGLLLSFVLARRHDGPVAVAELDAERRARAAALPWVERAVAPRDVEPGAFAHALHTSATADGLQLAIDAVGFEGQVTELSWYGDQAVSLRLGDTFHWARKRLVASQVATVAPLRRAAGRPGRTAAVLELLRDAALDRLLAPATPFAELPSTFAALYAGRTAAPCPVVGYE